MCCDPPGDHRLPEEDVQPAFKLPPRSRAGLLFFACVRRSLARFRNSTRADLSLGRWLATNTCFFRGRAAYSVPSLALGRAGLPSCASQPKNDGNKLPCGGPLPDHGTTTQYYFASKQTTGYAAFGSRRASRSPFRRNPRSQQLIALI